MLDEAKSKILATADEDSSRGISDSPTPLMHLSSHVQPHGIKKRKKAEKESTALREDVPLGSHHTKNLQKESVPDTQREERHVTPGRSMMILDQALKPLDGGSDGQKNVDDSVMLKRKAQSNPRPRRKKRKVTQHSEQPSCCVKDETSNPGASSPHNVHSTTAEVSSNSTVSRYLEAMNTTDRTPISCDNGPCPMYTPVDVSIFADNGTLPQSSSPGIGVVNPTLYPWPLPQLDIEEQHRIQAQYESLLPTTSSMEDGSFVGRFSQSQDFADEIHSLPNEHVRLNGYTMATSTILAMEQPLQVEAIAGRALYEVDLDLQMRKEQERMRLMVTTKPKKSKEMLKPIQSCTKVPEIRRDQDEIVPLKHEFIHYFPVAEVRPVIGSIPMSPKPEPSELDLCPSMPLYDKLRSGLPAELYRMKSVSLGSPTGLDVETPVKAVEPEIHLSPDRGPSLSSPRL